MQIIDVRYDPQKEKPRPRTGLREFLIGTRVYIINPGVNKFTPAAIADLETIDVWQVLVNCESVSYDKRVLVDTEESKPEDTRKTVAERTAELEKIYGEQGYKPIEALAHAIGIDSKPDEGWKSTIPIIINRELNAGTIKR